MKDIRIQHGDISLISGKDIATVGGKEATATLVQTITMGLDHTFSRRIQEILCSQSVRQMSNSSIAELLKEEVYERLISINMPAAATLQIDAYVDKYKNSIKLIVRTQDKSNFTSEIQFIGSLFTDTFDIAPAEVVF